MTASAFQEKKADQGDILEPSEGMSTVEAMGNRRDDDRFSVLMTEKANVQETSDAYSQEKSDGRRYE